MLIMFLLILYIALLPTKAIESILLWYSLPLTAGEHKITFKNQYGQALDIDKIQLKEAENNSESNTENINLLGINTEPPFTNGIFSIDYKFKHR